MPFSPTPTEVAMVNEIFHKADPQKLGIVTGEQGVTLFAGSNLDPAILGEIWAIADPENNGYLTRKGVAVSVRLIGWAQNNAKPSHELLEKPGPIPVIEGITASTRTPAPIATNSSTLPALSPEDRAKYIQLFNKAEPINGLLSGQKARDVLLRSRLPTERLNTIWNLVDTQGRGALDVTQFILAMYFIRGSMGNATIPVLPPSLPPYLVDQASGGAQVLPNHTGGSIHSPGFQSPTPSFIGVHTTGNSSIRSQPHSRPPPPTVPSRSTYAVAPQLTGQPFPLARPLQQAWDITADEKAGTDAHFDTLDVKRTGYIDGGQAVPFMMLSNLPEDILARIWDLSDLRNEGKLNKDTFAVAMHLINGVLTGSPLPASIPASLIPPSLRQPAISETHQDLLSLTEDVVTPTPHIPITVSPPPSVFQPTVAVRPPVTRSPPLPAPVITRDLLDDFDDLQERHGKEISSNSVEIANTRNQLSSTQAAQANTQKERERMEAELANSAASLSQLQTQLASAKAGYETETKLLSQLQERYSTQTAEINTTRSDLIRAESDLSALKLEKTEIQGNLLQEKDDVRDLKQRLQKAVEETETLKKEIEQVKKDSRLQKGLLAITKKQLAAAEAEKEAALKELTASKAEAEAAAKEVADAEAAVSKLKEEAAAAKVVALAPNGTPSIISDPASRVASPALDASGVTSPASIQSNNPFDRLRQASISEKASPFVSPAVPATTEDVLDDDPFGFNDDGPPTAVPLPIRSTTGDSTHLQQVKETNGIHDKVVSSPDAYFTPPTAQLNEETAAETKFPDLTLGENVEQHDLPPLEDVKPVSDDEDTSSDEDDDRPLGVVKAELNSNENATPVANSGPNSPDFDDAFGLKTPATAATITPANYLATTSSAFTSPTLAVDPVLATFDPNTKPVPTPTTAFSAVDVFDQAMGLTPGPTGEKQAGDSFAQFEDSFGDTFDFDGTKFAPLESPKTATLPAVSATPATAAFDDAFGFPTPAPSVLPNVATPTTAVPLSFDDAFEVSTNGTAATTSTAVPETAAVPFPVPVSPKSLTSPTKPTSIVWGTGVADAGIKPPTPTSARSPSPSREPSIRTVSPPPRTSSPHARPSSPKVSTSTAAGSTHSASPEIAGTSTRSSRISIHFPSFGRKATKKDKKGKEGDKEKDKHSKIASVAPVIPASIIEDGSETPTDGNGDVPAVKRLVDMGFTRDQAVNALEGVDYDFGRALNTLLK